MLRSLLSAADGVVGIDEVFQNVFLEEVPFWTTMNASPYRARASRPSLPLKEASRLLLEKSRVSACWEVPPPFRSFPREIRIFRWKFKKSAEFSNFQRMFHFSSGRFGFPAGKFIFQQIF